MGSVVSEDEGEEVIDFQTLSLRLEGILAEAHAQLLKAQEAFASSHGQELPEEAVTNLQGMDVGTQTVAAVKSIMGAALTMADPMRMPVRDLVAGVTLSDVVLKIYDRPSAAPPRHNGVIDFF
ncbi:hypothetical protein A0U91_16590 (plasmid) [Acetobacter persici]|uniref:Uncharacterized protein n=2 Tax=Acetobacter persici TaxID=1076596 RepID=A0A1U9LJI2_9PROT|nr:hypothetical protein A0U91_16590 [Acetobacter persici]